MPYSVEWYIEPHILYTTFTEDITLETIQDLNICCSELMRQSTGLVHIILDVRNLNSTPLNVVKVRQMMTMLDQPNMGWLLIITDNPTYKFMGQVVPQIMTKSRSRVWHTVAEAMNFLRDQDKTVDWPLVSATALSDVD